MQLFPVKTPIIQEKDNLIEILINSMNKAKIKPKDGDILVVSSKVVALTQGRIINYRTIKPSKKAKALAKKYSLHPGFVEIVLKEADVIYGGVYRAVLTMKNKVFVANAGADLSNAPEGYAILWPKNPSLVAKKIKKEIEEKFKVKIGVIISDSHCIPLRAGTFGFALATAGFNAVIDEIGKKDLFGKRMRITRRAVADDLASAAQVLMGETDWKIPAVLIRDSGVEIKNFVLDSETLMPPDECLYSSIYVEKVKKQKK